MSVKIILFGDSDGVNNTLTSFRCRPFQEGEQIRVENIQAGLINYLLFAVKDMSLVVSQVAGASGLVCFFSQKNVPQLRGQLTSMLSKHQELEGIPLVVAISANSKLVSLREIMSQLQQLKTKDRVTLIRQVDFESKGSIESILEWLSSQRNQVGFDAQPRVVKAKPKYRDEPQGDKTYQTLMKDKKFKAMSSINQQTKYLALQKQRIKQINMQDQLNKFIRNKQKMTPYDIKPSPNPRIEPNLNFFLKDVQDNKVQQTSIKIQTDEFKPRPPSPKYIPKKTGIDCSTQVQDNELFDFDREVQPILNVLTIRTLEQAVLDIEQQQQMFKMAKFRELYQYKKKQQKNLHREYLLAQQQIIRQKQQLLKKRRGRHESKLNCFKKVQAYNISSQFTNKIYSHTLQSLSTVGFITNEMSHQLHTDYLDHLLKQSTTKLQIIQSRSQNLQNCFDQDCILPLLKIAQPRKKQREQKIIKANKRRINRSENTRVINLLFNSQPSFNQFVLNFNQHFDGTQQQYQRNYSQKLKQIQGKVTTGQMPQDSIQKYKQQQLQLLIKDRTGILLDESTKYGFVLSHNQHEPTQIKNRYLSLKILALNQNNQILEEVNSINNQKLERFEYNKDIRDNKQKINYDESLEFDFKKLEFASLIVFIVKISNLQLLSKPELKEVYQYAAFGLESSVHAIPIIQRQISDFNFLQAYKPEEEKADDTPTTVKNCLIVPFVLVNNKKLKGWYLQTINHMTKPIDSEQQTNFLAEIVQYWKTVCQQQKDAEQQQQIPQPPKKTSREGKRDRRKSKQQQVVKKVVVQQVEIQPSPVSRMFPQHQINLNTESFENINQMLQNQINQYPEIVKSYPYGYNIRIKGKPFTELSQLLKYRKLGDLTIVSNPEPVLESSRIGDESIVEQENAEEPTD